MKKDTNAAEKYDSKMRVGGDIPDDLVWFSPHDAPFRLLGMGWEQPDNIFRRMPVEPAAPLPEAVDALAWHTAGLQVSFETDSRRIAVRVKLRGPHTMGHMPATGQCGFDAYIGNVGEMTFAGVSRAARDKTEYTATVANLPDARMRRVVVNFPLYQGVDSLDIGLETGSRVAAAPASRIGKPVVIYGTSITQGGCASRPGMAYPNILSRRIDAEFINLGFSGSGRGEPEVARVISTIREPGLLVMDYEANCGTLEKMSATLPVFLEILRAKWPEVPILVVSKVPYALEAYDAARAASRLETRDYQKRTVADLRKKGDGAIFFLDGGKLLGKDFSECSVDGAHQTDLGFLRMADNMEKAIRRALG